MIKKIHKNLYSKKKSLSYSVPHLPISHLALSCLSTMAIHVIS